MTRPRPRDWSDVLSFACQLQHLDLEQAARSPFDLLIIDYSRDGSLDGRYTRAEVERLQSRGRRVLAYLSVGEAESYRFYWKPDWKPGQPAWLKPANRRWAENYRVDYSAPEWHAILKTYLAQIQEAGFDGAFLDVVDAWEALRDAGDRQARARMAELILELAGQGGPGFGLVLNGGEELIHEPGVADAVIGVAKEEIFYGLEADGRPTPRGFTRAAQSSLRPWLEAGKLVLSIDYATEENSIREAHRRAGAAGYREYVAWRGLDRLVVQPTLERPESPAEPSP